MMPPADLAGIKAYAFEGDTAEISVNGFICVPSRTVIYDQMLEVVSSLLAQLTEAQQENRAFEEREAACCPEDVGFDLFIHALSGKLHDAEAHVADLARQLDESNARFCEAHQVPQPDESCPCCEAVRADDEAKYLAAQLAQAKDEQQRLIGKWRAAGRRIDAFHATMGVGYKSCADDLEAALSSHSSGPQDKE